MKVSSGKNILYARHHGVFYNNRQVHLIQNQVEYTVAKYEKEYLIKIK